jgi:hypothetical protein
MDDFDNALFAPMERENIAIRAVFSELNALIEWELGCMANEAHFSNPKTKSVLDVRSHEEIKHIKLIYDLSISKIHKLIEDYYNINISSLPEYEQVHFIRKSINAFKHRKGYKDFRKEKDSFIGDKFILNREIAFQAIKSTMIFLRALWEVAGNK